MGYSLSKTTSSSEVIPSSEPKIGAFSFDINFSLPGTYTFDVTEIKGDDEAYQYDNAKYHIEYKITLNADNVLQESHTIKKETLQPTQSTTEVDKIVFENVHAPKTSVQVTKVWNDNNNQDGKRPESVTIKLLADGKVVEGKTLTLTAANNWTGTFSDLDGYKAGKKIAYTVEEITISNGYEVSVTGTAADGYTVTNTYHAPKMGGITIEKEVTGTQGDKDKKFHFTVTLDDKTISGTYGDMEFTNGVAEIILKHGEKANATGLPAGTGYTVVEKEANSNGYTTSSIADKGTIPENSSAEVKFTNHKDGVETPKPDPTPKPTPDTPDDVPQTGDTSNISLWIALACFSVFGIAVILFGRKQRHKRHK